MEKDLLFEGALNESDALTYAGLHLSFLQKIAQSEFHVSSEKKGQTESLCDYPVLG